MTHPSAPSIVSYPDAPSLNGRRTAALAQFTCRTPEEGAALLEGKLASLASEGFDAVLAPMEGDTWHAYRYVVESDGSPPFLMEPPEHPVELAALDLAGFRPVATYCSARAPVEVVEDGPIPEGVSIRAWDGGSPERFLADVHALSREAFARNPFYKDLSREGFDRLYAPMVPRIDPRLMLFAHDMDGGLLGFVFGLPDMLNPTSRAAILKTYASRRRGVGRALVDAFNCAAREAGFQQVIHALMHEGNESLDRSGRQGGTVFRRYALLGREIAA